MAETRKDHPLGERFDPISQQFRSAMGVTDVRVGWRCRKCLTDLWSREDVEKHQCPQPEPLESDPPCESSSKT